MPSADCLPQAVVRHALAPFDGLNLLPWLWTAHKGPVLPWRCSVISTDVLSAGSADQAGGRVAPHHTLAPRRRGVPAQAADEVLRFKARLLPEPGMVLAQHESMRR